MFLPSIAVSNLEQRAFVQCMTGPTYGLLTIPRITFKRIILLWCIDSHMSLVIWVNATLLRSTSCPTFYLDERALYSVSSILSILGGHTTIIGMQLESMFYFEFF